MILSIIIPTYNRNELLKICLDRLHPDIQRLNSEFYEVIVSDDSEQNNAKELIENNYSWVRWISGKKKGPACNRNNGAKQSEGKWLIFLDDDVIPDKSILNNYFFAVKAHSEIKVFEGYVNADRPKQRFDEESPINISGGNLWSCNFMIERELFFDLKGFDETFPYAAMEDIDFHKRIKNKGVSIHFLKDCKVIHPWRRVFAFKTIKKHFLSHKHFKKRHFKSLDYRSMRIKVFLGGLAPMFKELIKYRCRGFLLFLDRSVLNFILIFA